MFTTLFVYGLLLTFTSAEDHRMVCDVQFIKSDDTRSFKPCERIGYEVPKVEVDAYSLEARASLDCPSGERIFSLKFNIKLYETIENLEIYVRGIFVKQKKNESDMIEDHDSTFTFVNIPNVKKEFTIYFSADQWLQRSVLRKDASVDLFDRDAFHEKVIELGIRRPEFDQAVLRCQVDPLR